MSSRTWINIVTVLSLVMTSGPTPLYAAVYSSVEGPMTAVEQQKFELLSLKITEPPTQTSACETAVATENFEPLQGALDRARQSVANTVKQGQDMARTELGVEGVKHLHAAIVEVQNRIGTLEQVADDREIKREIGKLTINEQLKMTLQTGARAEIYAQHFAAAEMLMIRRLIAGLAEVAEMATANLQLNEKVAILSRAAATAEFKGKIEILRKDLNELQKRSGEFITSIRKASELELEFDGAINRLDDASQAGQKFIAGLTPNQLSLPAIRTLLHSLTNLSQMTNGAKLFKQTVREFDSNIVEAQNRFDENVAKTDLALQARLNSLSVAAQRQTLANPDTVEAAKTKLAERNQQRLEAAKARIADRNTRIIESSQARAAGTNVTPTAPSNIYAGPIMAATAAILAIGALIGFLVLKDSEKPSNVSKPSYERSYTTPSSPAQTTITTAERTIALQGAAAAMAASSCDL